MLAACPVLQKLLLPSLGLVQNVVLRSNVLEDILVSRVHGWQSGDFEAPLEKFKKIILSTPRLRRASVGDVSELLDIQSPGLQYLSPFHAARCTFQFEDLSHLIELEIDADTTLAPALVSSVPNYAEFQGGWSLPAIQELVVPSKGTLEQLSILNPGMPPATDTGEGFHEFFNAVAFLQVLHIGVPFLENLGERILEKDETAGERVVLLHRLEEVYFYAYGAVTTKHADYLEDFLVLYPNLKYMSFGYRTNWPHFEGEFIRGAMALQRRYPKIEIDLQMPQELGIS